METIKDRLTRIAREIITLSLTQGLTDDQRTALTASYLDREAYKMEVESNED